MSDWISVDDIYKPKNGDYIIVWIDDDWHRGCYQNNKFWFFENGAYETSDTRGNIPEYWMPEPKKPTDNPVNFDCKLSCKQLIED